MARSKRQAQFGRFLRTLAFFAVAAKCVNGQVTVSGNTFSSATGVAISASDTASMEARLSELEGKLDPDLSDDNKKNIFKSVHTVIDENTFGNYDTFSKFDPRMFPSPVVWPKFAGQEVMSSNANLRYSTVKYKDQIFLITSAHNTGNMPPSASSDFGYENIFPTHYLDNSEVDMFLRKTKNFVTFAEQFNLNSSMEYYPGGGKELDTSSDLWGTENVIIKDDGSIKTTKLILQTTHKGLIVSRLDTDTLNIFSRKKEIAFMENIRPVAYFHNGVGNSWGDVKTFDQTTLNVSVPNSLVQLLLIGTEAQLTFHHRNSQTNSTNKIHLIDTAVEMRILSIEEVEDGTQTSNHMTMLELRVQTIYQLRIGDHFNKVALWNSTGEKHFTNSDITVHNVTRNSAMYFVKERGGRLMTFDTTMDKYSEVGLSSDDYLDKNGTILKPILTNTIYNVNTTNPYWEIKNGTTDGFAQVGNLAGAHNLWVSHTQQLLFVVGLDPDMPIKATFRNSSIGAIVYDISGDNMFAPKPKAFLPGADLDGLIHDLETVSYTREEQIKALGIPSNNATDMLHLAIVSTAFHYVVYNTTDIENVKVVSNLQPVYYPDYYKLLAHQSSMTSDKKYFIVSDELQDFEKVGANVHIYRLYYDGSDVFLKIKYVQEVTYATPSLIHNQYVYSNNNKFSENKERYEDWIVGANYHAGFGIIKLNYDEYQNVSKYTNTRTFELRNNPFTWKEIGNLQPTKHIPRPRPYFFTAPISWGVFAFGDMRLPASRRHYIGSTASGTVAFVHYDKAKNDMMDPKNDGYVQLLHTQGAEEMVGFDKFEKDEINNALDATRLPLTVNLETKQGSQLHEFTNIGHSQTLDFVLSKMISPNDDRLDDIFSIEAAESTPEEGEKVYAVCGNDVISGHVVKKSETFNRIYPARVFTDEFDDRQANGVKFSRTGEMITTLKCRPGDSGSPVVNSAGYFVGIVNSVTLTSGTTGVVKFENMRPHLPAPSEQSSPLTVSVKVPENTTSVYLTGPRWSWSPYGMAATNNGDGVWTVTLTDVPTADMEYLWVVDGNYERLIDNAYAGECYSKLHDKTLISNFYGLANRVWRIGSGNASNVYDSCVDYAVMETLDSEITMSAIGTLRYSSVPDDNKIMKIEFNSTHIIDKINNITVDADTTHETLLRIPYHQGQTVEITMKNRTMWTSGTEIFDTIPYRDQNRYM